MRNRRGKPDHSSIAAGNGTDPDTGCATGPDSREDRHNNPVSDQAGGRVVPRDDQLKEAGKQFLLGQAVAIVAGGHQYTDEIVLGMVPVDRDEALR